MDLPTLAITVGPIVAGYFIGGIPFGIVVARVVGGPDPRSLGSGRTGGANVMRALGFRAAVVAGLLDAAKGAVAAAIPLMLGSGPLVQVLAALAAILGHSRSPYIRFGGGRGIAPGFGGLAVIAPLIALVIVPIFGFILVASRISSLASLTSSALAMIGLLIAVGAFGMNPAYAVYAVGGAAMIWLFHSDNIRRLLTGQERRIEFRR
ncbi:MAG TPA: glycerol-3-phosphate 1-O-acyltransferase PlsY [Candidatus Acidoferrum sp.]|nr:glycerol-3-phosphate 1-O-acyltransferase PlsY [Candidatus Acidoferrum sp.]